VDGSEALLNYAARRGAGRENRLGGSVITQGAEAWHRRVKLRGGVDICWPKRGCAAHHTGRIIPGYPPIAAGEAYISLQATSRIIVNAS